MQVPRPRGTPGSIQAGDEGIEGSPGELLVGERLDLTQPCALAAWKSRAASPQVREVMPPLYPAPRSPHLECCIQLWSPQPRSRTRGGHRNAERAGDRLRELALLSLEKRSSQEALEPLPVPEGVCKKDGDKRFSRTSRDRTRGNIFELREG